MRIFVGAPTLDDAREVAEVLKGAVSEAMEKQIAIGHKVEEAFGEQAILLVRTRAELEIAEERIGELETELETTQEELEREERKGDVNRITARNLRALVKEITAAMANGSLPYEATIIAAAERAEQSDVATPFLGEAIGTYNLLEGDKARSRLKRLADLLDSEGCNSQNNSYQGKVMPAEMVIEFLRGLVNPTNRIDEVYGPLKTLLVNAREPKKRTTRKQVQK